jgi:hypothetical protein
MILKGSLVFCTPFYQAKKYAAMAAMNAQAYIFCVLH